MKTLKLGVITTGLLSVSSQVLAQTALEEIVVTATKQEESLSKLPLTVNAISAETIQEAGIENLEDVAQIAPSLQVRYASSAFGSRISIRGIGTYQTDPALEPSVGLFVDGVFLGRSGLGLNDLSDIERIEVLQGPQGTLYGKNANAGAISIVTKKPSIDEIEGHVGLTLGNYNLVDFNGSVSGPLSDKLAFRLTGNLKKRDGYYENSGGGQDLSDANDWSLQGKLFWEPTDNLSILLSGSHVDVDNSCCGSEAVVSDETNTFLTSSGFQADQNNSSDYNIAVDHDSAFTLNADLAYLTVDYAKEFGVFKSITAWDDHKYSSSFDPDRTVLDVISVVDNSGGNSFSQEFRFNSNPGGQFDYLLGAFYHDQKIRRGDGSPFATIGDDLIGVATAQGIAGAPPYALLAASGDHIVMKSVLDSQTLALFAQGTLHFQDRFHLTGGLRYSDEKKEASLFNETISTAPSVFIPAFNGASLLDGFVTPVDADLSRTSDSFDWLVRANMDISDRSIIFASASTGTKSGGFNTSSGPADNREFADEHTTNYEVGIKYTDRSEKFRANATAFVTIVDDYQFQTQLASGAGLFISNDAQIEVSGIDFQFEAVPNEYLHFSGGLLYMDKYEVTEGVNAGTPLLYTADWNYNVAATVKYPVASGEVYWRTDYSYVSDHEVTRIRQTQNLLNSRIGWRAGDWDVAVWGKNITDEVYALEAPDTFGITGTDAFNLAAPATYGISVGRSF